MAAAKKREKSNSYKLLFPPRDQLSEDGGQSQTATEFTIIEKSLELSLSKQVWEPGGVIAEQVYGNYLEECSKHDITWMITQKGREMSLHKRARTLITLARKMRDGIVNAYQCRLALIFPL